MPDQAIHGTALPLEQCCALDHVLVSPAGNPFHGVTDEALKRIRPVAVVPRRLALRSEGLAILEPPVRIRGIRKVLAWHERTRHDPGLNGVRALLLETCRQSGPRPQDAREVL